MFKFEELISKHPVLLEFSRFFMILRMDYENMRDDITKITSEYDISSYDYKFLTFIHMEKEILVNELADLLGVTNSTVSILLNGLEEKGLIKRVPAEDDRRKKFVHLTGKGSTIVERAEPTSMQKFIDAISNLTETEKETFVPIMRKLTNEYAELLGIGEIRFDKKTQLQRFMGFE